MAHGSKRNLNKLLYLLPLLCRTKSHPSALVSSHSSQVWYLLRNIQPALLEPCASGPSGQQVKALECTLVCQVLFKRTEEGAPRRAIEVASLLGLSRVQWMQ